LLERAVALLATSLFADVARNRLMMVAWLGTHVRTTVVVDDDAQQRRAAEHERQAARERQRRAVVARTTATTLTDALDTARTRILGQLVPAATATLHRRIPHATHGLFRVVGAMNRSATQSSSPLDALTTLIRTLLLARVRLTLVADAAQLHVYVFGRRTDCRVPGSLLSMDERRTLEFMALLADYWIDGDEYVATNTTDLGTETLVATSALNDVIEVSLDRAALVWALCETILYGAGEYERVRHVLEAALLAASVLPDVLVAGHYDTMRHLAHSVHVAPLVPASRPAARFSHEAAVRAHEYARRFHVNGIHASSSRADWWSAS